MAIITISREFGGEGDAISQGIIKAKHIPLVDKAMIGSVLSQYGMVTFHDFYDSEHSVWDRYDSERDSMVKLLNQTILAFAKQDNLVILGRGGFAVLQDYDNVLNVLIQGSCEQRVLNIMKTMQISDEKEALRLIDQNDRVRRSFLQTYYNLKTEEVDMFDLAINTDAVPADMAVRWIVEAADQLDKRQSDKGRSTRGIDVDSVLETAIKKALGGN